MAKNIWEIKTYGMESGDNCFAILTAAGVNLFSIDDTGNLTITGATLTGSLDLSGTLDVTGAATFDGSVTIGTVPETDTLIINSRIATVSVAGAALDINDGYTRGELIEIKANVSDWTNIPMRDANETFVTGYFRAESSADDATAILVGVEGWGVANGVGLAQIEGLRGWAYAKGDTTDTLGAGYGVRGEFSMDAGRGNTLTITTEVAGVLSRITSGVVSAYTKIHGFIGRFGDMDGGSRKYGSGLRLLDGVEAGTSSMTNILYTDMAADYFYEVSAADIGAVDDTIAGQTPGTINAIVKCKFASTDFYLYGYAAGPS